MSGEAFLPGGADVGFGAVPKSGEDHKSGSILSKRMDLADLVELDSFKEIVASFADMYRVGLKVFDFRGNKLVDVRVGNGPFCGYMWEFGGTRQACTRLVTGLKNDPFEIENGVEVPRVVDCFTGLRYVNIPVHYEGDLMGRLIFGPYMPHSNPGPSEEIYKIEGKVERRRADTLVQTVRRAPDDFVSKVLAHLHKVIEVVLFTSLRQLMTSQMHIESVTESFAEMQSKNKELAEQNDKLKEVDKLKSNFLATVSHELRTPLTSVIGYSEMLLEGMAGAINDEQRDYIKTIMDKGESLLQMISQILDLSKIENGNFRLNMTDFDISAVAKNATTSIVPQCTKKSIQLNINIEKELPYLHGDRDKVGQIIVNLLGNAVKFTPTGGSITMKVSQATRARTQTADDEASDLFALAHERFVRIDVTDTGVGIPADKQAAIFERFFQVDNSSTREFGGTGLGLSIVKNFVEAHGGLISVESHPGQGSVFSVMLPAP
jgi:two-component system, NarL family, sensor histidine kinase BarA